MELKQFIDLIRSMPVQYQAFSSKRQTWERYFSFGDGIGSALEDFFQGQDTAEVSRDDLFTLGAEGDLPRFVLATVLWGYPSGMRGNHVRDILTGMGPLCSLLADARATGVGDWKAHFESVRPIQGIGLSTYTKFLHFLRVQVGGNPALILDDRIIRVSQKGVFKDFSHLTQLTGHNAVRKYSDYLAAMAQLGQDLNVDPDRIEMFLFEFGLNLKGP